MTIDFEDYETISVGIRDEENFLNISSIFFVDAKEELIEFLNGNADLFTWKLEDMHVINLNIIIDELNVDHMKKSFQQRKMRFAREMSDIIKNKVNSLKKWDRLEK